MREVKFRAWNKKVKGFVLVDHIASFTDKEEGKLNIMDGVHLMQYTGFKDKNGVEIYEGDIVTKNIYWDVQKTKLVRFTVKFIYGCFMLEDRDNRRYYISKYNEIIGNIYENKELLDV